MSSSSSLAALAERLRVANGFSPVAAVHDELDDMADAYEIQSINRREWVDQGRLARGYKVAFTTLESQQAFGATEPVYGTLFEDMRFNSGGTIPVRRLAQPKLEGEIVLELGTDLPAETLAPEDVSRAVCAFYPALEIPDGCFEGAFNAVDMAAANGSAAAYVLGGREPMTPEIDLAALSLTMKRNGEVVSSGVGEICMGNPLNVLIWLQRALAEIDEPLRSGQIVYCGSLVPIIDAQPGDTFEATVAGVGSVSCEFAAPDA